MDITPSCIGIRWARMSSHRHINKRTDTVATERFPLPACGERVRVRGRQSAKTANRFARELRKNQTDAERRLWLHLRDRRLAGFKFRRQYPVGACIADFACLGKHLIVEVDGGQHNERQGQDVQRTRFLERRGFRVLRFWNNDVLKNTDAVLNVILDALDAPSSPALLPEGEGSNARVLKRSGNECAK